MSANFESSFIRVREEGSSRLLIGLLLFSGIAALLICIAAQGAPLIDLSNLTPP